MKIIRWWGIAVFIIITTLLVLTWYLVAPMVIKSSIETAGTKFLGAKLDIEQVDLQLFPLGITIKRLEATDADQPMSNLVEIETIRFSVDSPTLLWKKILIDKVIIDGVQLATKRSHSGAIETNKISEVQTENENSETSINTSSELTKEDIKKIVAKADLVTLKNLKQLEVQRQTIKIFWEKEIQSNEHENNLIAIESEFNRLSKRAKKNSLNLIKDRKSWKKLKKNISKERKSISNLNKKLKTDKKELLQQIVKVKNSPKIDRDNIMSKTGINNGLGGMSQKLSDQFIGPQFTPWLEKIVTLAKQSKTARKKQSDDPTAIYETDKGPMVQFKDEQTFPKLLIKKVSLSGKDDRWSSSGSGDNLGYYPWTISEPANININIKGLKDNSSLQGTITSDWESSEKMNTQLQLNVKNWKVQNVKLLKSEQGSWMVNSGNLNALLVGKVTLDNLDIKLDLSISNPNILPPENLSGWQNNLAIGLSKTKLIKIMVSAKGDLSNPKISFTSNLEKIFTSALGDSLKQKASKYKEEFSQQISKRVGDLSGLDALNDNFDQWSKKLQINDSLLKSLKVGL